MSAVTSMLNNQEKARFLEASRLAGLWYVHTQNAPGQPWGGVDDSADTGRFIYEYFPATGQCRGTGIWSQGLAIAGLMSLSHEKTLGGAERKRFRDASKLGAGYLLSLRFLDSRYEKSFGSFREKTPQVDWVSCRDGATGCFGIATMAKLTDEDEEKRQTYLETANMWCKWVNTYGSDEKKWPYRFFRHKTATPEQDVPGDWQAGGALAYYYTAKVSGDDHWIHEGLKPVAEQLLVLGDPTEEDGSEHGWHGESRISVGNDDFATITALAAFLSFEDERHLDLARKRVAWMMEKQASNGAFPNGGGTFVTALTLLDFIEVAKLKGLPDDTGPMADALLKAARHGLGLQETKPGDLRTYGGLYGQCNYGVSRDRIHNRSTSYSMYLYLRLAGGACPIASAVGW